jgi:hypothetical protein
MERRSKVGRVERRKILMPIYKFRVSTKDLYILNILPTYFFFFFWIMLFHSPVYQSHPNC